MSATRIPRTDRMIRQRTLKSLVSASGVGLHSGVRARIVLRPAAPDAGVVFHRVDMAPPADIAIAPERIGDTRLCSTLELGEAKVATVEHLMSALAGLGIDNVHIDIDGPEVPIMDGSSAPFVFLIQSAGIEEQNTPKRFVRIKRAVEVRDGDKWARFEPFDGFRIHFKIQFDHPVFEDSGSEVSIDFADASYVKEIARARTFGFMHEVEWMRGQGLALGGSLDNAIVMDEYRVLNPDGLRYEDEFVKHKVLDAIGDLYMLGHPIIGAFNAYKSGHALNNKLLRELMAHADAWEYVSFEREQDVPPTFLRLHAQPA